jgi:hypothetical protein
MTTWDEIVTRQVNVILERDFGNAAVMPYYYERTDGISAKDATRLEVPKYHLGP